MPLFKSLLSGLWAVAVLLAPAALAQTGDQASDAQQRGVQFFRIATGQTSATYYAIGRDIAAAISNPPGGAECDQGGACGIPGLLAAAIASGGSVENISALRDGRVETGLAQADIAFSAHNGGAGWQGQQAVPELRAIAALYPEAVHVIARADAGIDSIADLAGKRVSINQAGSGSQINARLLLQAAGLPDQRLQLSEAGTDAAAAQLRAGDLDAFVMVGGWPITGIAALAAQEDIKLLPIDGALAERLMASHPFFQTVTLPAGTYAGQEQDVPTLSVAALWLTTADQPDAIIRDVTRILWNDYTLARLQRGHSAARAISREAALTGITVPLHPGAAEYYQGAGLLPEGAAP